MSAPAHRPHHLDRRRPVLALLRPPARHPRHAAPRPSRRGGRLGVPAVAAVAIVGLLLAPLPSLASDSEPTRVQANKVVDATADLDGTIQEATLLTELEVFGDGVVSVTDPTVPGTVRPLSGFVGPEQVGDEVTWTLDVDGSRTIRSAADWDRELPVAARVSFTEDGERVDADDLGDAEEPVTTSVSLRNLTGQDRLIGWQEGGETTTERVDVPVPLVARVTATFDEDWHQVQAPEGVARTTGEGATEVTWVALLFEPFGALDKAVGAEAATPGDAPPEVEVEAAPVTVGEAAATEEVVELIREGRIDTSVLAFLLGEVEGGIGELAEGFGELVEGIAELAEGSRELTEGIGEVGSGADELTEGSRGVARGIGELGDGADELAAGTRELASGVEEATEGIDDLAAGAREVATGVDELVDGAEELAPAADEIAEEVAALIAELEALPDPPDDLAEQLAELAEAAETLRALADALEEQDEILAELDELEAELRELRDLADEADEDLAPALEEGVSNALALVELARTAVEEQGEELAEAAATAAALVEQLDEALEDVGDLDDLDPEEALADVLALSGGVQVLADAANELAAGGRELAEGTSALAHGLEEAAGQTDELTAGVRGLAEGAGGLATGLDELEDGAGGLTEGARGLATGLDELEDGAAGLAEGAEGAAEGAAGTEEGIAGLGDLADQSAETGDDLASSTARDLALIEAMDDRVERGDGIPAGVPTGAQATGAYHLTLADDGPDALDPRVPGAVALLAMGALLPGWVRRRLGL